MNIFVEGYVVIILCMLLKDNIFYYIYMDSFDFIVDNFLCLRFI